MLSAILEMSVYTKNYKDICVVNRSVSWGKREYIFIKIFYFQSSQQVFTEITFCLHSNKFITIEWHKQVWE